MYQFPYLPAEFCNVCRLRYLDNEPRRERALYGPRESANITTDDEGRDECPICLEPKNNPFYLVCGHWICTEHVQMVKGCPLCRVPVDPHTLDPDYRMDGFSVGPAVSGSAENNNQPSLLLEDPERRLEEEPIGLCLRPRLSEDVESVDWDSDTPQDHRHGFVFDRDFLEMMETRIPGEDTNRSEDESELIQSSDFSIYTTATSI